MVTIQTKRLEEIRDYLVQNIDNGVIYIPTTPAYCYLRALSDDRPYQYKNGKQCMDSLRLLKNMLENYLSKELEDKIVKLKLTFYETDTYQSKERWSDDKSYQIPRQVSITWKKRVVKEKKVIEAEEVVVVKGTRKKSVKKEPSQTDNIVIIVTSETGKSMYQVGRILEYDDNNLILNVKVSQDKLSNEILENALNEKFEVQGGTPSYYMGDSAEIMTFVMNKCIEALKT